MKNTITILALFCSLLAVHAEAKPVQLHKGCNKSSRITHGIVASISELIPYSQLSQLANFSERFKLHKSAYTISIILLSDNDGDYEYDEHRGKKPHYSEFEDVLTYEADSEDSIATYNLLKESYTYLTSVVVVTTDGRGYTYHPRKENILLPYGPTKEACKITSAEKSYQCNSSSDFALGYDPEATWHRGRVLQVIRYRPYNKDLPPMCTAVVEGTENTVEVMPERFSRIFYYADLLPERLVYQVESNRLCQQLERAAFSPSSPVEFQFKGGCTPKMNWDGWIKHEEILRCRRQLSALRGVET